MGEKNKQKKSVLCIRVVIVQLSFQLCKKYVKSYHKIFKTVNFFGNKYSLSFSNVL